LRFSRLFLTFAACLLMFPPITPAEAPDESDPFLWLEEVQGEKALDFARRHNAITESLLAEGPEFKTAQARFLSIMDSKERIPYISKRGEFYYNFWQDASHPKGVIRRTSLVSYQSDSPDWETVLDFDALAKAEGESWVYKGLTHLHPPGELCLVRLSRGGADATVLREFNLLEKKFVKDGFYAPEAKHRVGWRDRDSLYIATDFGPGSLTESGYPRVVKEWKRGTPLSAATLVFEGEPEDISVSAGKSHHGEFSEEFIYRAKTFYANETSVLRDGKWVKLDKPDSATIDLFQDQLLLTLRDDYEVGDDSATTYPSATNYPSATTYPSGALLVIPLDDFLAGKRDFDVLFRPTPRTSLASTTMTKNWLVLNELDEVKNKLYRMQRVDGKWTREAIQVPGTGTVGFSPLDAHQTDDFLLTLTDFLTPASLYLGSLPNGKLQKLKANPAYFKTEGLEIQQHHATSKDGTKVPYFQVSPSAMVLDGSNPTLINGYGGFEIPLLSNYRAITGSGWLEKGGVFVLANIRGGGEFGPAWHQAALKANRQKSYDDFIAIAEDLIARKVTSPAHLGVRGGSNGGLLMGNMLVQRPDLFEAIVCQVPLLDMKRYNKLLAGASWVGEYGDPDKPEEWAFLEKYSPYHQLKKDATYPRTLFTTSTRDDRVHPGHARKMVARMEAMGHDVLYHENIEGGHGGAANNKQRAYIEAMVVRYLWKQLK